MTGAGRLRLPGSLAEVESSPDGPKVGAFFDLDGTLIAGYSATHLAAERLRSRDLAPADVLRALGIAVGAGLGRAGFEDVLQLAADGWKGRNHDDLEEMGQRLFLQKLEGLVYPEMREFVRAHQRRGHTVVLCSSATSYQAEPVAAFLGIDRVLCNRFVVDDGVLTGEVQRPVLWGAGKANAVQRLATELEVDLGASYFYADGDEDAALMYLVGHPRPTNPGRRLARVAATRGWPVIALTSRGGGNAGPLVRTLAGLAALGPIATMGTAVGVTRWNRRAGLNMATPLWLDALFAINGVKLRVQGRENLWAQRPAVFIFNHRNNFDPFITGRLVERDFTAVAKKELAHHPVLGPFGKLADLAFIDRTDSASAVASLQAIQELAKKGLSIIVAPEGTRLDTTGVGPFKKGAFRIAMAAGIPIVPVVIRNAELIAPRNASAMHPGTVDVVVLPPIPVDDWTTTDLPERIEAIRAQYLETLRNWPDDAP